MADPTPRPSNIEPRGVTAGESQTNEAMLDPKPQPSVAQAAPQPAATTTVLPNQEYRDYARQLAEEHQLPPDIVEGLWLHESQFDPVNVNPRSGATGIGQLTRSTARKHGLRVDAKVDERKDPYKNMDAAIQELAEIHNSFPDVKWSKKILAYQMGINGYRQYAAGERKLDPKNNPDDADSQNFSSLVEKSILQVKADRAKIGATTGAAQSATQGVESQPQGASGEQIQQPEPDNSLTEQYMPNAPTAVKAMSYGLEQAGKGIADFSKSAFDSVAQFPREVGQMGDALGYNTGQAIANTVMPGPPQPYKDVPVPSLSGAANFAALPLTPIQGRGVNAGINVGLGVLNTAEGLAREAVAKEGKNWNELGFGEQMSYIASQVTNTDNAFTFARQAVIDAGLGLATGGSKLSPETKARMARESVLPKAERLPADFERLAAGKYTKLEAEDILGVKRQKIMMSKDDRRLANQEIRAAMEKNWFVPADNPGKPALQELSTKYGKRELDARLMPLDEYLLDLRNTANKRGLLQGDPDRVSALNNLLSPIDPAFELKQELIDLRSRMSQTTHPIQRQKIYDRAAAIKKEIDALPIPTVDDLTDRMANFDRLRRDKTFRQTLAQGNAAFDSLLKDSAYELRKSGGFVDNALDSNEQALWAKGTFLTRKWYEDKRTLNMIGDAFKDGLAGGSHIRDELMKASTKEMYVRKLGQENYDDLLKLARAADILTTRDNGDKLVRFLMTSVNNLKAPAGVATIGSLMGGPQVGLGLGTLTAFLLTNRTAQRQFEKMVRFSDKVTSNQFLRAYSRFMTTAMIHHSYQQPEELVDNVEDTKQPEQKPGLRDKLDTPPPTMPTRPTGGPIPAPSPGGPPL